MNVKTQWLGFAALIGIFAGGLFVRLALSPFWTFLDTGTLQSWMQTSADYGIISAYRIVQIDYPPVGIAILTASEYLYRFLIQGEARLHYELYEFFVKLPSILADYSIGFLLFTFVSRTVGLRSGLIAAIVYLLNPAAFSNSSLWGQTDSMYMIWIVASILSFSAKKPIVATLLAVLAVFTKAQAVLFMPLFALLLYLHPHKKQRLYALIAGAIATAIIVLPFVFSDLWPQFSRTFMPYSILKSSHLAWSAYNVWWLIHGQEAGQIWFGEFGTITRDSIAFASLSYKTLSLIIIAIIYAFVLYWVRIAYRTQQKGYNTHVIFRAALLVAMLVFLVGTDMHERYLFPAIPLALPLVFIYPKTAVPYALLSIGLFINMLGSYQFAPFEEIIAPYFQPNPWLPRAIAVGYLIAFAWYSIPVITLLWKKLSSKGHAFIPAFIKKQSSSSNV